MQKLKKFIRSDSLPLTLICAGLLGAVIFALIYGIRVVDPTYDDWIFVNRGDGDIIQHYSGWRYYRQSQWHFPIGLIDGINGDSPVSCMYTDSIPLLAVFFKIISPILPETFQYIGLWELITYILMGVSAALLLRKFNSNIFFCTVGSAVFVLSPTVIYRAFWHEALSGQWIIILAIVLWVYQDHQWKKPFAPVILWTALGVVSAYVHSYFIPMIYMIMLGYMLTDLLINKKIIRPLAVFASTTAVTLFAMYCMGAFYGEGSFAGGGFGYYSSNLNTLYNGSHTNSKFLNGFPLAMNSQKEGFGYLGFGVIVFAVISIIAACCMIVRKNTSFFLGDKKTLRDAKDHMFIYVLIIFLSMVLAVGPVICFNDKVLRMTEYPEMLRRLLSIFRCTGRFIWVTDYLIYTAVFAAISRMGKKQATAVLSAAACLVLQAVDMSPAFAEKNEKYNGEYTYELALSDSIWSSFADRCNEIVLLPLPENFTNHSKMYMDLVEYAYENNMTMSSFYIARAPYASMKKYADEHYEMLASGSGRSDVIYVFFDPEDIPASVDKDDIYELNGYTVVKLGQE